MLFNFKRLAKAISYRSIGGKGVKRDLNSIKYIVIHYTSGVSDTAKNELDYFATGNQRSAGAHYFVDRDGKCGRSVYLKYTAWSVGGNKYPDCSATGGGKYYGKCTNANSVSIELCGIAKQPCTAKQIAKTKKLIAYIQKHCPNAKTIIRHFDVTGKICPSLYIETKKWNALKKQITP